MRSQHLHVAITVRISFQWGGEKLRDFRCDKQYRRTGLKLERNYALRITHIHVHVYTIIKYAICLQNPKTQ